MLNKKVLVAILFHNCILEALHLKSNNEWKVELYIICINLVFVLPLEFILSDKTLRVLIMRHFAEVTAGRSTSTKWVGNKEASRNLQYIVSNPAPRFTTWQFCCVIWNTLKITNQYISNLRIYIFFEIYPFIPILFLITFWLFSWYGEYI